MRNKNEKLIRLKKLSKIYKDAGEEVIALDDANLEVDYGEDLVIVGPSGSGKTTLLQLIGTLDKPTSGEVYIDEKLTTKGSDTWLSEFRNKTIGFIFQMMYLQEYFTAVENVMLPMLVAGSKRSEAKKRAEELLEKVGLEKRNFHLPRQLSGGEMQRVAIARALANKPKLLLADEPTAKLDKKNAENVLRIFKEISEMEQVSVLIITHDEAIAKQYDRSLHIEHGKLTE